MARPILMTIDDEPHVLNAIARDLQSKYQKDYRIVKAKSGAEALAAVEEFKRRSTPIALFLVDQRMPAMSGVEFLTEAIRLYPDSKRVLLTAYADTDAAIASINAVDLDYYLMKPWNPPEERLYPVLDDLLSDWLASVPIPYDGLRVAGTLWSPASHDIKDFLARSQIPYQWLDIERDSEARTMVESTAAGSPSLPVLFFPDGTVLANPDLRTVADKMGLTTRAEQPFYELIIIGGGPAGLAAAVYGASEGVQTILIEKDAAGGQAGTSARIENYLGFPTGISGADLTRRATTQAKRLGAEIITAQQVTGVRIEDSYRIVTLADGSELSCHALMIATGAKILPLEVPGIEPLIGRSVYYGAATSEAVHYRDKRVFVLGGGNSAGQGAMFLSRFSSEVTLVVRRDTLEKSMSHYLIQQIEGTENISLMPGTEVTAVAGESQLESITLRNASTGDVETVPADALFIFIGAVPNSDVVAGVVERTDAGFILTGPDLLREGRRPKNWRLQRDPYLLETSVPGIFAAGDIRHGAVRRVASAVGQGSISIYFVQRYLESV
jgi:thioredoxin reductase (NADPH)